jgi:phosphopentomutase
MSKEGRTYDLTDHSREYVPILAYGQQVTAGTALGTRQSFADIGQTIAHNFGLEIQAGTSFLPLLT